MLALLGLPSFALSLAITTVGAYAPGLITERAAVWVAGVLIGSEGLFALVVPGLIGRWSDRWQGRMPFLLVAAPVAAVALVMLPLAGALLALAGALAVFYVAYFTYLTPYLALYPDLVSERLRARSQGALSAWREVGLGVALVGGGVLLDLWRPLPFLLAGAVLIAVTLAFSHVFRRRERDGSSGQPVASHGALGLLRERPALRSLLAANALWEVALSALRAFVVLFLTVGLGRSATSASLVLALVVPTVLVGALAAGKLVDRFGQRRVLSLAVPVYGLGLLLPFLSQSSWVLAALPPVGFAAALVMTLPFALVMDQLGGRDHGAAAGLFAFSRGVGLLLGPLIGGLAVTLLRPVLEETQGFAAVFALAALAVLLSWPFLRRATSPGRASPAAVPPS